MEQSSDTHVRKNPSPKSETTEEMPPPGLDAKDIEEWWRKHLSEEGLGGKIETLSNYERKCGYCGSINPCTGADECGQCSHSLKGAKRIKTDHRHTPDYY